MLLFKKHLLPAIRSGEKTQTIRLWKHRHMRTGQRSYIPGAGYIHVESVELIQLNDLTEDDAHRDGFPTLLALKEELSRIYQDETSPKYQPYRIKFRLVENDWAPTPTHME